MATVWKYKLAPNFILELPENAQILYVGEQYEEIYLWALVDPSKPVEARRFVAYGTGHEISEDLAELSFIGTVLIRYDLVFHIFEEQNK